MSKPNSRATLKDYCLRRLGYPVLEINVDDDQIDDLTDDAIQYFQERHFDGIERVFLKHKLTEADIATAKTTQTTTSATTVSVPNAVVVDNPVTDTVIELCWPHAPSPQLFSPQASAMVMTPYIKIVLI